MLTLSSTMLLGFEFEKPSTSNNRHADVAFSALNLDVSGRHLRLQGELLNQSDHPLTHIRVDTNCTLSDGSSIHVILDTTENYISEQVRNRRTNHLEVRQFSQPKIVRKGQRLEFDITKKLTAEVQTCSPPIFVSAVEANSIFE